MPPSPLLPAYTREVLRFRLAEPDPTPIPAHAPERLETLGARLVTALRRDPGVNGRALVLLGLGSGQLAGILARSLRPDETLCVLELSPERARQADTAGHLAWAAGGAGRFLAVDTSPWALALLSRTVAPAPALATVNPELPPQARGPYESLRRLLAGIETREIHTGADAPALSLELAAILHPEEPDLPAFFAQISDFVARAVCVWDAPEGTNLPLAPDPRRVDILRPLAGDFSAQRNALLAACRAEWVLMLDADERLDPWLWALLPHLCGAPELADVQGCLLPRLTLYPDAGHAKAGYGMWPDLQLRLFRRAPGLRFERRIHERLRGLSGKAAILPGAPIVHLSRLAKSREHLAAKLAGFDAVSGGTLRHRLNEEYPHLPRVLFPGGGADTSPPSSLDALVIPGDWA